MKKNSIQNSRRQSLKKIAGTIALGAVTPFLHQRLYAAEQSLPVELKGKINHSVCKWCYNDISLEDLCKSAKDIGLTSIELLGPDDWPTLKKYGLTCAMPQGAGLGIERGFNDLSLHDELVKSYEAVIPKVAEAGYSQIICFSGNRRGLDAHG